MGGGGRTRTFTAEKTFENQGAAPADRAKIQPSSWHSVGSSADLIPSLSELRYSLGIDDAEGRPRRSARSKVGVGGGGGGTLRASARHCL
jgi:hypothetical protein